MIDYFLSLDVPVFISEYDENVFKRYTDKIEVINAKEIRINFTRSQSRIEKLMMIRR